MDGVVEGDRLATREPQRRQHPVGGHARRDVRRGRAIWGVVEAEHGDHELGAVVEVDEQELPGPGVVVVLRVAGMDLGALGGRQPGGDVLGRGVVLVHHQQR